MAWKTDKISIGYSSLSNITLDVSGTAMISSLKGAGSRIVTISPDGSLGATNIPDSSVSVYGLFGDGILGDVILDASIDLSAEMFYNNLTINSSVWINTKGFIIRVLGTLTISPNAHIACDGGNGGNGYQNFTYGGAGGTTPYSETSGAWPFMGIPAAGNQGQYSSSSGSNTYSGSSGGSSDVSTITYTPYILRAGSGGGGGATVGSDQLKPSIPNVGMIAGRGGTGKTSMVSGTYQLSGGGGGAGGGVLIIYAKTINNSGSIHANGGKGGNGFYISGSSQSGGGGGGGGGVVIIYYRNTTGSGLGTITASGGSVGSYGTGGSDGTDGLSLTYQM